MSRAAIYCRLSDEDRNKSHPFEESESITNQKAMLLRYASDRGWEVSGIYSDDDFGGGTRERPEFRRLLEDAEAGRFDIILCKSQSRFTREIELVEKYINYLLPLWGIRFVSVVDNADTSVRGNKKSRQINGLINEWYLEDLSENIKAVLTSRRRQGLFIGAFAPYGYKKDPDNKGHLIIDEPAADIVREIFELYTSGVGKTAIAKVLNERSIPTPYRYKVLNGEKYRNSAYNESSVWNARTVSAVLGNEVYIGNLIQNRFQSVSYKTKHKKAVNCSEWIKCAGTHEAIIDMDTWQAARELASARTYRSTSGAARLPENVLSGKLFCKKCGSLMTSYICGHKRYLRCSGHLRDRSNCTGTYLLCSRAEAQVLAELKSFTEQMTDADEIAESILSYEGYETEITLAEKELARLEKLLSGSREKLNRLYSDRCDGYISNEIFKELSECVTEENRSLSDRIRCKEYEISELKKKSGQKTDAYALADGYLACGCLTRDMARVFIDRIYIDKDTGKGRDFRLEIHWNF